MARAGAASAHRSTTTRRQPDRPDARDRRRRSRCGGSTRRSGTGCVDVAGLEVEALYGWFDRRPFDDASREFVFVARKPVSATRSTTDRADLRPVVGVASPRTSTSTSTRRSPRAGRVVELAWAPAASRYPIAEGRRAGDRRRPVAGMLDVAREATPSARASSELVDLRLGDLARAARRRARPARDVSLPLAAPHGGRGGEARARSAAAHRCSSPAAGSSSTSSRPAREDIEETDGLWLEREPGIFERADWDAARADARRSPCAAASSATTMELALALGAGVARPDRAGGLRGRGALRLVRPPAVRGRRGPDLGLPASALTLAAQRTSTLVARRARPPARAPRRTRRGTPRRRPAARLEQLAEDVAVAQPVSGLADGTAQRGVGSPTSSVASPARTRRLAHASSAERLEPVELEQHPETAAVAVDQAERRARDERRRARVRRPGAVLALDQRQRAADEVGERVGPRALDHMPAHLPAVHLDDVGPRRATASSSTSSPPEGDGRADARAGIPARRRAHERRVALPVVEPAPIVDEEEPPVLERAVRAELDRLGMVQPQALDRCRR